MDVKAAVGSLWPPLLTLKSWRSGWYVASSGAIDEVVIMTTGLEKSTFTENVAAHITNCYSVIEVVALLAVNRLY